MSPIRLVETDRLVLRRFRASDRAPFAKLNADPEVMEHFPSTLTRADSDALIARIESGFESDGFAMFALEVCASGEFIGFTGLSVPRFEAHFMPAVEVGWRLARHAWGQGYATEAARAALAVGFDDHGLTEIVSFTAVSNARSQAVMERLGMHRDPRDDFDHPALLGHRLARHVLYRITAAEHSGSAEVPINRSA